MIKDKVLVRCVVNGKEVAEYVDPRESLLDMLRNRLGLTSVKKGCEVGECGACTVIIDGETIDSCIYLAVWADGKNIRTLESLLGPNGELSDIQQAFIDEVVPHELAHLLVWKHFGRVAPHGKEWKWMMESVLGVPALRTHRFELDSVRKNTFPYRCQCQQHQLTVRRHNRVMRGEATYRCVRCGDVLVAEK